MTDTGTLHMTKPTEREIVMTRVFDAPRQRVFDAGMDCEALKRWYGTSNSSLEVCEIDPRVGGGWRALSRLTDGKEVSQRGVYREFVRPERTVSETVWEGWHPGEILVTTVYEEDDGKTKMTCTLEFPSQEVRDQLEPGLKRGSTESYDRLAEYLRDNP